MQTALAFTAADTLLRIVGGPQYVDRNVASIGVRGFQIVDGEAKLHRDKQAQYRNWLQPAAAAPFLRQLADRSALNQAHSELLPGWMRDSPTGAKRLKGELPEGTALMHKTGTSGVTDGLVHATNDIGLIRPARRHRRFRNRFPSG